MNYTSYTVAQMRSLRGSTLASFVFGFLAGLWQKPNPDKNRSTMLPAPLILPKGRLKGVRCGIAKVLLT
jgi:hypothetical protein